jgi:hypothetical protein
MISDTTNINRINIANLPNVDQPMISETTNINRIYTANLLNVDPFIGNGHVYRDRWLTYDELEDIVA